MLAGLLKALSVLFSAAEWSVSSVARMDHAPGWWSVASTNIGVLPRLHIRLGFLARRWTTMRTANEGKEQRRVQQHDRVCDV